MATPADQLPPMAAPAPVTPLITIEEALQSIRLIGVAGAAGSGKGTVAEFIQQRGALVISCADPIKDSLTALFGFAEGAWEDRNWKERMLPMLGQSPRQLAQTLGTEWGRNMVNEDLWIATVVGRWRRANCALTVVPDIRFDNEAMAILRAGGVMIRVTRPDVEPVAAHSSEHGLPDTMIHQTIENNGTLEDLAAKVDNTIIQHVVRARQEVEQRQAAAENHANGQ